MEVSGLMWLVALAIGIPLAGATFQAIGEAIDRRRYPPPGVLVRAGRVRLHVYSQGQGSPTVILESGIAASSLNWRVVQTSLASQARVISYDRAGFGWSDAAATPRTLDNLVLEMQSMLEAMQVEGPLILVGHSFGTLVMREYCARNRARVAGMVLLDPIDAAHWRMLPAEERKHVALGARLARRGAWLARLGIVRLALMLLASGARWVPRQIAHVSSGPGKDLIMRITGEVAKMPREVWPAARSHWSRPQSFHTMARYLSQLECCAKEVDNAPLGDLPLVVISAQGATSSELAEHRRVTRLSTKGEHIVAEGCGHWIHLDRPALVINCVQGCSRSMLSKPS